MSENRLEEDLVRKLEELKYSYRDDIRDRAALEANFRQKFEALNRVSLTDHEFRRLLNTIVTPDVYEAARILRNRESFTRDDGTPLNYTLVNTTDWCKNTFEVVNQLRINTDYSHHRYDVIILINGIPVVHIELKAVGVDPRRAMAQIVAYKDDPGNGFTRTLLCFVQFFIVSNRAQTFYFANNNREHFAFDADERFLPVYRFADRNNEKIGNLDTFAEKFLAKCTLGQTISRYMVLIATEQKLLMMRPYQIYAVKAILDCIDQNCGNGYIWHTTGSGKTLTSFKAATLLKAKEDIDKCLFVVDRKDLDRQTREEFNRFQENCVEENTNTATLVRRLLSDDYADKVIVTTIQKLGLALNGGSSINQSDTAGQPTFRQRLETLRDRRMVFIFDECHRSQFGTTHETIKTFFPRAQFFGFTGTPIFEKNALTKKIDGDVLTLQTTKEIFQRQLHAYTITHAIEDQNVLGFKVDYFGGEDIPDSLSSQVITKKSITETILDIHARATGNKRFNALLATASINDAIAYHETFKTLQLEHLEQDPEYVPLKVAAVFSPPADGDKDIKQLQEDLPQEMEDNLRDPMRKKAALEAIIADYNKQYGTAHEISNFDHYYQDIQQRIKDQMHPNHDLPKKGAEKIDICIVVDMLLTGFDAKFLNTLYVDKNLRHHSLIQAFSRTNRVLNAAKPFGKIIEFRQQQDNVDEAIELFSGTRPERAREIWLVEQAPAVIESFEGAVANLNEFMHSKGLEATPDQVTNLSGDTARACFINLFREVQQIQTRIDQYTDLTPEEHDRVERILPRDDLLAFRSAYLTEVRRLREQAGQTGQDGTSDEVEPPDLKLVLFASALIDYDYIMNLIAKYSSQDPARIEITREQLIGLICSDAKFLNEQQDISEYVKALKIGDGLDEEAVRAGYEQFKARRQANEITALARTHGLSSESLSAFIETTLQRMIFDGEQLTDLMAPLNLGWRDRNKRELKLMKDLAPLLKKRTEGRTISGLSAYDQVGAG